MFASEKAKEKTKLNKAKSLEESKSASSTPLKGYATQSDTNLVEKLPPKFRPNALTILSTLKPYPSMINRNKNGTVTFFGNEEVQGSSIIDLVSYILKNLKWTKDPFGVNRFLAICKLLNVPTSLLSAGIRKDWFGTLHHIRPRDTVTESAAQLPKFRKRILDWDALDKEDIFTEDEEEPINQEENFHSFD